MAFQRAYRPLAAQMEDFVQSSEKRMIALMQASLQDVVNNAQTAVAKGGRMRVDTGFLRASGQASVGSMPTGPVMPDKDAKPGEYSWSDSSLTVALGNLKLGQVFYFGWTANYARYRELYDGFLEGALMQWGRIVAFNTDTIRQRFEK